MIVLPTEVEKGEVSIVDKGKLVKMQLQWDTQEMADEEVASSSAVKTDGT